MAKLSRGKSQRNALIGALDWALRDLSTSAVVSATATAQQVGMGPNDLKCAELLVRKGSMTAGQLAEASGLTTGAITGVVDRLEKAGWARREPDAKDRRRVFIHPGPRDTQALAGLYDTYVAAMGELLSKYTLIELELILDFVRKLSAINYQVASEAKSGDGAA